MDREFCILSEQWDKPQEERIMDDIKINLEEAKEWDLLSYLMVHEPEELKKSGPEEYRTKTHDSLVISNGKWIRSAVSKSTKYCWTIVSVISSPATGIIP